MNATSVVRTVIMCGVSGGGVTAQEALKDTEVSAPAAVRAFPTTLGRYSSRNATT